MGLVYPSIKNTHYFVELYKTPFATIKTGFNAEAAYKLLRHHPDLSNAEIQFLNLSMNRIREFISFDKRKNIFGGDLLLPENCYHSAEWQDLKSFAKEYGMGIGYHLLICDTTCLLIKRGNQETYLINPRHIQPKGYLFKSQNKR